jgi:hypothetical protein
VFDLTKERGRARLPDPEILTLYSFASRGKAFTGAININFNQLAVGKVGLPPLFLLVGVRTTSYKIKNSMRSEM